LLEANVAGAAAAATPPTGTDPEYTLTLTHGLGQTLFVSNRREWIVGALPTGNFSASFDFGSDDPPNVALVAETGDGNKEILIVELINPIYDESSRTATYDVRILQDDDLVDMSFTQDPSSGDHADASYGRPIS